MVTWLSFIASSSADCVFGVVRLISSASRKLLKIGPGLEFEGLGVRVVDGDAEHVAGQHVAGELQAVEAAGDGARQGLRQRGLADAGHVLDQQVAARQQADQREPHHFRLCRESPTRAPFPARPAWRRICGENPAGGATIDSRWDITSS